MRKHAAKQIEEATIDLTPMLDVVFIMLIFFIVTATFVKQAGIDVLRPDSVTAEDEKGISITIAIDAKNNVYIERQLVPVDGVRTIVERLHADNPKGVIAILADTEADVTVYGRVHDAVKQAGAERIILATEEGV